jgi:hypothetical protein
LIYEKSKKESNKKTILSAIANSAIRPNNLPGQKKYLHAEYQSERNKYRSPINYITQGLISGFTRIVLGKAVQKLINKEDKKSKRRRKKEIDKNQLLFELFNEESLQ